MNSIVITSIFVATVALPAFANDSSHEKGDAIESSNQASSLADGEVRKVDKDAQKITVRHGALPELGMPKPMTMVYRVKDPAMLDKVKAGDKVKFQAAKIGGAFTLTAIEPAK